MMDGYPAADGLRRRRGRQEAYGEILPPTLPPLPNATTARSSTETRGATFTAAHFFYLISVLMVIIAIVTPASGGGSSLFRESGSSNWTLQSTNSDSTARNVYENKQQQQQQQLDDDFDLVKAIQELFAPRDEENPPKPSRKPKEAPVWIRWLLPPQKMERQAEKKLVVSQLLSMVIDPTLLHPSPQTPTDIIDKVIKSTPRLLVIANFFLLVTYLIHGAVANFFLGSRREITEGDRARWAGRERLGGFLLFKLLLISAVVIPDTLDLLILVSWYTLLSVLRSLDALASATTSHTSLAGQPPKSGVLQLLLLVLLTDVLAAAMCAGLFHGAGWGMVCLLTSDCAGLAVDLLCHILRHVGQGLEDQHSTRIAEIEDRQLELHEWRHEAEVQHRNDSDLEALMEESRRLDRRMEVLEARNAKRCDVLETTILVLQLFAYALVIGHFLHIWWLHGLQFTLIDGVLVLHLHSAFSAVGKLIAQRRKQNQIARDLDGLFEDASGMELRKATAAGDVCCICMGTMSTGNVKKVGCGHMYHTHCLREVVERARSMEAARCPLCRASVMDGTQLENSRNTSTPIVAVAPPVNNVEQEIIMANERIREAPVAANVINNNNNTAGEHALFRFSTEGFLPAWLPLPAFSFEVVRRPPLGPTPALEDQDPRQRQSVMRRLLLLAGAISMTPEEEAVAMEQLVDMFPQYDRADLLRELRARGSAEDVAESVLLGAFTGIPRGDPVLYRTPQHEEEGLIDESREWERVIQHANGLGDEAEQSDTGEHQENRIDASEYNGEANSEQEETRTTSRASLN